MLSWWAHYRARNTYTRTSLTSKTPTHTQHKESVPQSLHSLPVIFKGCGEESQPSSSIYVISKHTRFIKQTNPPSLLPTQSKDQPLHTRSHTSRSQLGQGKQFLSHSWPYHGQNDSIVIYSSSKTWNEIIENEPCGETIALAQQWSDRKITQSRNGYGNTYRQHPKM